MSNLKNLESNDEGLVHTDEQCGQQSDQQAECLKKINELTDDEIRALEFDSEEHAYEFYSEYAKVIGFAVRKDEVYRDRNDAITLRQLICNRQGERCEKHLNRTDRVREAKPITRTTMQKFEDLWNNVIEKHGLGNNKWVRKVYDMKKITTSICEGINSFIKRKEIEKVVALNVIERLNKAAHINPHNLLRNIEAIHKLADQMERQEDEESRYGTGSVDIASSKHANHVTLSLDGNSASGNGHSKFVHMKKKRKPYETVKLTQESINEKSSNDFSNGVMMFR
ncbi:FAR1 DNA-binding domain [Sesbania bispinosa]|nr:FAR1 DNA-binding domain [Sesbania bispinosa]